MSTSERGQTIGLAEAAAKLRVPHPEAYRLMLTGVLPGEKVRSRWMVRLADVERLIRVRASEPAPAEDIERYGPRTGDLE